MAGPATYGQWSFNGGEVSPRMVGRVDAAIYANATAEMLGWLPLLQGPATAAPGTIFVGAAAGRPRLIPFEYNPTQGYVIEASAAFFRFYTNNAIVESAPGVPLEVVHGYSYNDILGLDYQQSEDVLYLAGGGEGPRKLTRTDAVTFVNDQFELRNGPIESGNSDETILVSVSATTGAGITIHSSAPIFKPTDVGRLFEIECEDFNDVPSWEPGIKDVLPTTKLNWGGRVYEIVTISKYTGTRPPEHDSGEEWDGFGSGLDAGDHGPYGCLLKYLYNRFGLARITGYTDDQNVTADVQTRFADSLVGTASWRWAFGAFSDTSGWPETVGLWNDCLVFTKGNRVFGSVIGDFDNFGRRDTAGDFQRDLAWEITLPGPAKINWQAADRYLLLGTDTAEYTVERLQVQTGTPGPPVFDIRLQSTNGSKKTKPVQADGRMLFVQRAGRKLREMGYAISSDRYVAPDMTLFADHIGAEGFTELAWHSEPERLVWAARDDGSMAAMTYDPEQKVMGWARRILGGELEVLSLCRITDPDGRRDQLWLSVNASPVVGGSAYWILRMAKIWEYGDDPTDQFFVDAGLSYDGAPAQTFSGLDHLEGETVDILADAKVHRQLTVNGGQVTLDYQASKVHIGLPFDARLKLLPPEVGQSEGVARGKTKRVIDVALHMVEAQGIQITVQNSDPIMLETRDASVPMDQATPLFTGIRRFPTIGNYEDMGQILIERVQPTAATIIAALPRVEVGER